MKPTLLALIMLTSIGVATAQDYKRSYWGDLGVGWGGQGTALDIGLNFEFKQNRFISARYSGAWTNQTCEEIVIFIPVESPLGKSADSYELSYGVIKKNNFSLMTFSAGLAYVNVKTGSGTGQAGQSVPGIYYTNCPDDYKLESEGTIGLALRAQFIPCIRWGGIGISPYVNINPKYVFGSFTITAAFGRLRFK